ncbi:FxLYD domain-containing protein [Bacillus sp. FJAT-27251]|uniref:FxLYD domain-containing protein n=1 Tax=Bacillus sp. FJAT-27251 TaxID=1684142 RepID=UPI0006A7E61B|nr:FxLYD domain-containing protein [Bacillus sp. FJAT-27251]
MTELVSEKKVSYKTQIIVYCVIILVLVSGFLLWYFYIRLDKSKLDSLELKISDNGEVSKYILFPNFSADESREVVKYKGLASYPYQLLGSYGEDFEKLTNEKKHQVFLKIIDIIEGEGSITEDISCGYNKFCSIDEIVIFNKNANTSESYTYSLLNEEIVYSYHDENSRFKQETIEIGEKTNSEETSLSTTTNPNSPNIEIVEKAGNIDGEYIHITGAVRNNSKEKFSFIEVKVTYTDDNGNILDTNRTYVNSNDLLLPNERKSFEVMTKMVGEKYTKYKVEIADYQIN